jgi:predicted ribosomally synthesized peptide with nif11-like leader
MAREQFLKLYHDAQVNPNLREALNTAPSPEKFVEMANQRGYAFTLVEWQEMINFSVEELECELSEIPGI